MRLPREPQGRLRHGRRRPGAHRARTDRRARRPTSTRARWRRQICPASTRSSPASARTSAGRTCGCTTGGCSSTPPAAARSSFRYNKFEFNQAQYAPYPAKVSSARVTDEHSPVTMLETANPVFTDAKPDRRLGLAELGAGARPVLPGSSAIRSSWISFKLEDPFELNKGPKRGALVEAVGGEGAMAVRRPRALASVASRDGRRVSAAGQSRLARPHGCTDEAVRSCTPRCHRRRRWSRRGECGAGARGGRGTRPATRSRAVSPQQTLRRRRQHSRPHEVSRGSNRRSRESRPRVCRASISRHQVGDGITLTSRTPAALMIRRVEFDALLLSLAREAGAEVVARRRHCAGARDGSIRRAAESRRPHVRGALRHRGRRRQRRRRAAAAAESRLVTHRGRHRHDGGDAARQLAEHRSRTLWVAYGYGGAEGYAYVFPKATHVNVGIGYVLDYYRTRVSPHPWDLQRTFTSELTRRGVLDGTSSRTHFTPYMIPVGGPLPVTATQRVMLAGDAGGFVNGITAEGIYYAMVSGSLAGRAALAGQHRRLRAGLAPRDRRRAARCRARAALPADDARAC